MSALTLQAERIALRRAGHFKYPLLKPARKRQKSSAVSTNTSAEEHKTIPIPNTIPPLPLWQRLGPLSKAFSAYGRAQRRRPYVTQFCSSLVIYFCGDVAAQNIGGEEYDGRRTMRNLVIGGICSIPSYKWFIYLGVSFNYASKMLSLGTKVLVNQIAFTPIFNSYFFGMHSLLSGDGIEQAWERIKRTVPVSFVNSCKLWPAVTAFSFTYIGPQYRSIFAGFIAIGWQSYLSWLNRTAEIERTQIIGFVPTPAEETPSPSTAKYQNQTP